MHCWNWVASAVRRLAINQTDSGIIIHCICTYVLYVFFCYEGTNTIRHCCGSLSILLINDMPIGCAREWLDNKNVHNLGRNLLPPLHDCLKDCDFRRWYFQLRPTNASYFSCFCVCVCVIHKSIIIRSYTKLWIINKQSRCTHRKTSAHVPAQWWAAAPSYRPCRWWPPCRPWQLCYWIGVAVCLRCLSLRCLLIACWGTSVDGDQWHSSSNNNRSQKHKQSTAMLWATWHNHTHTDRTRRADEHANLWWRRRRRRRTAIAQEGTGKGQQPSSELSFYYTTRQEVDSVRMIR